MNSVFKSVRGVIICFFDLESRLLWMRAEGKLAVFPYWIWHFQRVSLVMKVWMLLWCWEYRWFSLVVWGVSIQFQRCPPGKIEIDSWMPLNWNLSWWFAFCFNSRNVISDIHKAIWACSPLIAITYLCEKARLHWFRFHIHTQQFEKTTVKGSTFDKVDNLDSHIQDIPYLSR